MPTQRQSDHILCGDHQKTIMGQCNGSVKELQEANRDMAVNCGRWPLHK